MKLEDCKPGIKVKAYSGEVSRVVIIHEATPDGLVKVENLDGILYSQIFSCKQLRKIAPKKDRPTLFYAFKNGSWYSTPDEQFILDYKKDGHEVWLMRGVKKV